jgi:hypothetical protein
MRQCFFVIVFQFCFSVCHWEGSGKPGCLKLNGTHQLLFYAADVNILGGSVHTVKKNTQAWLVASKEVQLEVNADKTKYMVMP